MFKALFEEEGRFHSDEFPTFSTRNNILGHLQQGGATSPLDRVRGMRFAANCVNFIMKQMEGASDVTGKGLHGFP